VEIPLVLPDQALAERASRPAAEIEPRVAASVTHPGLVARLIAPSVAAAASGRGLGMGLGELWWQDILGGAMPLSVPLSTAAAGDPPPVVHRSVCSDCVLRPG
jgi:hypothetical protein